MRVFKHIAIGLTATLLLLLAKLSFEQTQPGRTAERHAYELLQNVLPKFSGARLPVVVVDISDVPGGKDHPTPRAQLQALIGAITAHAPTALAIDIDFSPNERGWITPADPAFFDYCLATSEERQVPIFLGVYRTRREGPDTWLGAPMYQHLAAAGLVKGADTSRVPRRVRSADGEHWLPTLGEALARAYRQELPAPPAWIARALERRDEHNATGTTIDVMVNYSKLDQLRSEHLAASRIETIADLGNHLQGRLVLLGDVEVPMDTFIVPGQPQPVPGVYLMAAAAYTLAFEPVYEFTHMTRITMDVVISMLIVIGAGWISRTSHDSATNRRRRSRFLISAILIVMAAGLLLMRLASILWLDFLLAPFAMLLHPAVEDWLEDRFRSAKKVVPGVSDA